MSEMLVGEIVNENVPAKNKVFRFENVEIVVPFDCIAIKQNLVCQKPGVTSIKVMKDNIPAVFGEWVEVEPSKYRYFIPCGLPHEAAYHTIADLIDSKRIFSYSSSIVRTDEGTELNVYTW
jgi:hypothetical protein